jgi:hypothetical protein
VMIRKEYETWYEHYGIFLKIVKKTTRNLSRDNCLGRDSNGHLNTLRSVALPLSQTAHMTFMKSEI